MTRSDIHEFAVLPACIFSLFYTFFAYDIVFSMSNSVK